MWRFAENNDKESIEFNSVEIFVDEESVRSLSVASTVLSAACASSLTRKKAKGFCV